MMTFQEAIARLLCPAAARPDRGDKPAVIQAASPGGSAADRIVTYKELQALIGRAQTALSKAGVGRGDTVLLCAPNSPELTAAILAAWRLGAIALPVDFRLTLAELENLVDRIRPRVICTKEQLTEKAETIELAKLPDSITDFSTEAAAAIAEETAALIILTSGTTGVPKGAVHGLGSLLNNLSELGETFGMSEDDRAFLPLPISHIFGLEIMLASVIFGCGVVLSDFRLADFWTTVIRLRTTMVVGVPTIYGALISIPSPSVSEIPVKYYLSGGAPLPVSLAQEFERRFEKRIIEGYGTTETKILCFNADGPLGSIGRPLPSVIIEIVDSADQVLPEGGSGELRVSGPSLMTGYLSQPEATQLVLHQGHYHTGDIGYFREGRLYISGRLKEMIIVAGNKVFPSEVETVLRQHPIAHEVAVLGVPHTKLGQLVKAVVVVKAGELCDLLCGDSGQVKEGKEKLTAVFREFCQQHLKRELRPMAWEFRPLSCPLPKTLSGKIDKKQLEAASV